MKELIIASNMIAMARSHKDAGKKRSIMLRMIMPLLSKETGDKLATAIQKKDSRHFAKMWDKIKHEITHKLEAQHRATASNLALASMGDWTREEWAAREARLNAGQPCANPYTPAQVEPSYADVTTFQRDGDTSVCIQTYGPRKIRISVNGNTMMEGVPEDGTFQQVIPNPPSPELLDQPCETPIAVDPATCDAAVAVEPVVAECGVIEEPMATVQINNGQTGENFLLTGEQMVKVVKLVCERLLMDADPCPLPARMMAMPTNCAEHDWPDCKVCLHGLKGFDFSANILELYDKLTASSI
jgi:hypothetical protein